CHNLRHEDRGMMMAIALDPFAAQQSIDGRVHNALTVAAQPWELADTRGAVHSLVDARGPAILVFIRSASCPHCLRQLHALARRASEFERAACRVLFVIPDDAVTLRRASESGLFGAEFKFPVLADPGAVVFRRYGCYDGAPLHGTFLIDSEQVVRWQD